VCGEYISNETTSFLKSEGLYPEVFAPAQISEFQLSAVNGRMTQLPLGLGGFGISRYIFDNFLFEKARALGVKFLLNTEVKSVDFSKNTFLVKTSTLELTSQIVIGAFGKRSKLDGALTRNFFRKRSPYVGVKYHAHTQHPSNLIALHNFSGGYCGISNIEDGKTNICYLTHRDNVKRFRSVQEMEQNVLFENPHLRTIFKDSKFLFEKPEVINEISFKTKEPVFNHILMTGDAAGMITPLCGNGMAMAIHSAKILSDILIKHREALVFNRLILEKEYSIAWNKTFTNRLRIGRLIQNNLFGTTWGSNMAVNMAVYSKTLARTIIKNTHGKVF